MSLLLRFVAWLYPPIVRYLRPPRQPVEFESFSVVHRQWGSNGSRDSERRALWYNSKSRAEAICRAMPGSEAAKAHASRIQAYIDAGVLA